MKKIVSLLLLATMLISSCLAFASCKVGGDASDTTKEEKPVLIMATNAAFPPYEYKEGDGFAGIDIELAQKIAEKLGMTLQIEDVEFGSIIGGVQSGKYHMGVAGMTVTEDRLKNVNFTKSYATGIQVVIVKEGSDITNIEDIVTKGAKIGVQQDTTGDIYASDTIENGGFGEDKVVRYRTGADAILALKSDKVDCVIIDNQPAISFVKLNGDLKILDTEYTSEDYAICVKKENTELLNKINKALDELIEDGTVASIIAKYISAK